MDIFWTGLLFCIKAPVETTYGLSLPGVLAHLLWAAFLEKIISREAAKPRRKSLLHFASWRLCEKKIISRKAAKPQRGSVFFCGMAPGISNSIYPQMVVVGANKYLESVIMVGMLMTSIWSITIGTYYSGSYPKSKIFYGSI